MIGGHDLVDDPGAGQIKSTRSHETILSKQTRPSTTMQNEEGQNVDLYIPRKW